MLIALGVITFLLLIQPDTRKTVKNAFVTIGVSIYRFVPSFNSCDGCKSLCKNIRKKYGVAKEIWHNHREGVLSWGTLLDFLLFKIRMLSTQYLENGLLKIYKKNYNLTYYDGDIKYHIRFPKKRGVRQIVYVSTHDAKNVTDKIITFMGPGHNFHGIPTNPKLLGFENGLYVKYRNGLEIFYRGNDEILLNYVLKK